MKREFLFIIGILFISCEAVTINNVGILSSASGTVKYISLEGGFYGIITDGNKNLDPVNLPEEFQVDGKRIKFDYKPTKDQVSFHMWGLIVELSNIKSL